MQSTATAAKASERAADILHFLLVSALCLFLMAATIPISAPGTISRLIIWCALGAFGASYLAGLLFFLHGICLASAGESIDLWRPSLRVLAALQIMLFLAGIPFFLAILSRRF